MRIYDYYFEYKYLKYIPIRILTLIKQMEELNSTFWTLLALNEISGENTVCLFEADLGLN